MRIDLGLFSLGLLGIWACYVIIFFFFLDFSSVGEQKLGPLHWAQVSHFINNMSEEKKS